MQVVHQVHQYSGPFFALFGTKQDNKRMYQFFQDYEIVKYLMMVLDLYIPKWISGGAGDDGSDEMSGVDN